MAGSIKIGGSFPGGGGGGGSGTVTKVAVTGAGIAASPSPITGAGTLSVQWNGGSVTALGGNLSLTSGTLDATGGGTGTVTKVVAQAGPFLADGTITASGTIANSATSLTANAILLGAGTAAVAPLGSLGTTTTVLHGNAAGAPTFGAVSLSADVSGLLPFANLATLAATSLFGNGAVTGATGGNIAIGAGVTLSVAGTLTAGGSGGTVTNIVAQGGPFLANGTISSTGTINNSTASLTAHGIVIAEGTGAAVATAAMTDGQLLIGATSADPAPQTMSGDATITKAGALTVSRINGNPLASTTPTSANLLIANGSSWASVGMTGDASIAATGSITVSKVGGNTLAANTGAVLNSGTVQINNSVTLTGTAGGTVTIAPTTGTSDVILNMPASGGTVTVAAAPSFARQRAEVDIKQGATAGVVTLNTGFVFGTSGGPTSYTAGTVASSIDRLMLMSPDGTKWAVLAVNQGFTL